MKPKGPPKKRFEVVFSQGRRLSSSLARIVALPGTGLVGFATSKKIGARPARNRIKRRFREALRTTPGLIDQRLDYVVIISGDATEANFERIQDEVRNLFVRVVEKWAAELECS